MPHYVMLSSLSESGRKVLRERPGWIRKVNRELEAKGAKVRAQYAVLGPYDFVTILEAPDNETVSSISIEMGARGSVSMMTMPAIPLDTFISRGCEQRGKPWPTGTEAPQPLKVLALHPEKCTGCLRCELACSYMQTGTFQPSKSVIRVSPFEGYTSYAPYTCTQCAEGWCMTACPVGAIQINAAGAKDVIDDKCVGCKLCTIACPYGTMFYDADTDQGVQVQSLRRRARLRRRPARRRPSPSRRARPRTGSATSRPSATDRASLRPGERRDAGPPSRSSAAAPRGSTPSGPFAKRMAGASEITLVSAERPYSRMVLPYYLGETIAESHVYTATPASLAAWKVKTMLGPQGRRALDTEADTLTLDDGATVEYDDCLIATGSRAARPPIPGADGPGVHSFWTLDEARAVIAARHAGEPGSSWSARASSPSPS